MDHQEIEVKFYLTDLKAIRNRIVELGATSCGRAFETNIRYEDDEKTLIQNRQLLRLRNDGKTTLTFKSKPEKEDQAKEDQAKEDQAKENQDRKDREFKVHRELEVEVDDFDTMDAILGFLGFHREQIYEKWRETFKLGDTLFCLDSMPYGDFLEIEGKRDDIVQYSERIGFLREDRILENYLSLFEIVKEKFGLSFSDVTFDNFKDCDIDPSCLFKSGLFKPAAGKGS